MMYSLTVLGQLLATTEPSPSAGGIVLVGFLFVVIVLATLASVTFLLGMWFAKRTAKKASKAAAPAPSKPGVADTTPAADDSAGGAAAANSVSDEEDPALIAVIAAAVHTVLGDRPHRLVSIRSAGPGWAQEGRRQIFSSHRLR